MFVLLWCADGRVSIDKLARLRFSICQTQPKLLQILRQQCCLSQQWGRIFQQQTLSLALLYLKLVGGSMCSAQCALQLPRVHHTFTNLTQGCWKMTLLSSGSPSRLCQRQSHFRLSGAQNAKHSVRCQAGLQRCTSQTKKEHPEKQIRRKCCQIILQCTFHKN